MDRPASAKKLHQITIEPFWSHMDALGHVNNAVYFSYCEQARIKWLEAMDLAGGLGNGQGTGPVVINACCTYHKPVVYPALLTVTLYGGDLGRSSWMSYYEISVDGEIYTSGSSKIVWVDYKEGKSVPVPEKIREVLT